ncbi:hypothetical protein M2444_004761 [Paenibacillus sp. PastF-3]|uniref:hypothetical protein n=1 Tax=unclassified Paenibacillus TaxID=185978 RepID=UPI000BA0C320|nr:MULTISPECIES: hypothetical protein [unclassified Paenibacillus]MBY3621104.1 hypothetical protein [Acinetobacter sp. CUI P1]MDH6372932.1 hypothetical protein [Paenibacillus sp. PastF-3]OZQ77337.1 hypothetical protein CA598_29850 [Paenibacillus sp. VTT E-133291]
MSNAFSEFNLETLLATWNDDFHLKRHDGEIRGIEFSKKYIVHTKAADTNKFIMNVTRLYKFMTFKKEGNIITLSVSVKPETMMDFLGFYENLKSEEKLIQTET